MNPLASHNSHRRDTPPAMCRSGVAPQRTKWTRRPNSGGENTCCSYCNRQPGRPAHGNVERESAGRLSARAVRAAWLVLAVGGLFRLRSRLLRPPRHRHGAVEGGQVVGLLGGDGLLPGVGLGAGGCGGRSVVAPDRPGQQGDGDERQAADEGQAIDDPAHGGYVLSGDVRGCSVVLGCLGMSPLVQNCAIPRAALMP
ncbi:MAG: hypothetical protein HXL00_01095 [Candidatus Nanosynbacter sp.]|nr:hypothetical protein [Candidatus Nanosynbacter sp.]